MLYREIISACSPIHTKHINELRGQNIELLSVKPGDIQVCLSTVNGYFILAPWNCLPAGGQEQIWNQ